MTMIFAGYCTDFGLLNGSALAIVLICLVFLLYKRTLASRYQRRIDATNRLLSVTERHEKLRSDALDFLFANDDIDAFIPYFAKEVLDLYGCDQVIYRDSEGRMLLHEKPGTPKLDFSLCVDCPHYAFDSPVYADGVAAIDDARVGYRGMPIHPECRVKSSLTQIVHRAGEPFGYIALHYVNSLHHFTQVEIDSFDRVAKFLSLVLDKSETQRRLKAALAAAESASRAKTNFLFSMSHDIRTPMNAIMGFTEIAKGNLADLARVQDCLDKTQKASELLISIVNSILDLSRIESGRSRIEESEADAMQPFANVDETMLSLARARGVKLTFELGRVVDRLVYADCEKVNRVLVNIISNSIKYARDDGWARVRFEQVGVKSKSEKGKSEAVASSDKEVEDSAFVHHLSLLSPSVPDGCALYRYTFEDNGIGMSDEFQKHVFDEFARERTSSACGIQGTGLGLALSRAFVEMMGGTIECRSKQGIGTTFTVTLPFRVREEAADRRAGDDAMTDQRMKHSFDQSTGIQKRLLLVEDNELNAEVAEYLLREQGYTVDVADNGQEAVDMICGAEGQDPVPYDVVLMDIQMPVMNGYEATRIVRVWEQERNAERGEDLHLPIIAVSANAFSDDISASLAAGMDAHVAKPIKIKELLDTIKRVGGAR